MSKALDKAYINGQSQTESIYMLYPSPAYGCTYNMELK